MTLNFNSDLNNDQKAFIDTAKQFAKEHILDNAIDWDQKEFFPRDVLKKSFIFFIDLKKHTIIYNLCKTIYQIFH